MKLASLNTGDRDGELVVVSRDLQRMAPAGGVAYTMQMALDTWVDAEPTLRALSRLVDEPNSGVGRPFDPATAAPVLPRAFQFLDGSAYLNHAELLRRARGSELPERLYHDPLMYQGASDGFLASTAPIPMVDPDFGLDLEAEVGVVTGDVPMGTTADEAGQYIRLVLLINDISLRELIPDEISKFFGFLQSKPRSSLSPVAVTPDALGSAWDGGKLHGKVQVALNGETFGTPDAGVDMQFDFPALIAHAAKTRPLCAGTIIGSGTVSNRDRSVGSCCIAERRTIETLDGGAPVTPFLKVGDTVRIEMLDDKGQSIFGAIDQTVVEAKTKAKAPKN